VRTLGHALVLQPMTVHGPRREPSARGAYLGFVLEAQAVVATAAALLTALTVAALVACGSLSLDQGTALVAAAAYACAVGFQDVVRRQAYVEARPRAALIQALGFASLSVIGFVAVSPWLTVAVVFGVLAASSTLVTAVSVARRRGGIVRPGAGERRRFALEHWRFGRWSLATTPFQVVLLQGYYILAWAALPAAAAGTLKAAEMLVVPFDQLGIAVSMLLVPSLAGRVDGIPHATQRAWIVRFTGPLIAIAAGYVALVVGVGPAALVALAGSAAGAAAGLVPIVAAIPLLKAVSYPPSALLVARRRPDLVCACYAAGAGCTAIVGSVLVVMWGVRGAAAGMVLSLAAYTVAVSLGARSLTSRLGPAETPHREPAPTA
jgi:O-antigen/teichoic acid export membrane protein